jgi:hypothetical protein
VEKTEIEPNNERRNEICEMQEGRDRGAAMTDTVNICGGEDEAFQAREPRRRRRGDRHRQSWQAEKQSWCLITRP